MSTVITNAVLASSNHVNTTATNLLVFQVTSSTTKDPCEHENRDLYCPLCSFAVCVKCVPMHNLHGLVPICDENVET